MSAGGGAKVRLSWKAVRKGARYCAPACGCGCTYTGYLAAQKSGAALAKRLGKGWRPRVHENCGWHFSAISPCSAVEVHDHGSNGYWANFQGAQQFHANANTPRAAVKKALARGEAALKELTAQIFSVRGLA